MMPERSTGTAPRYQCLLLIRVSTTKQSQESDSPEHQLRRGLATAKTRFGVEADRVFVLNETWSGRKDDRPSLDQAFELAKTYAIPTLLVYDIDRLTRAGPAQYEIIKRRFKSIGCSIVDVKGVIQPDSNTLEGTGGDLGQDFAYDWSIFAASEKAEVMEAQMAKDEARKILSRTIPVQIRNAQLGRTNRPAQYGFANTEIIDESGKPQASKIINEEEAWYVRKLCDLMAAGEDIRRVCDELNAAGFRTRSYKRWNSDRTKVVGTIGGNPMTPRMAREMIARPVYAGFILEKWTHWQPVPANHDGIVTRERWNQANSGIWALRSSENSPTGWERVDLKQVKERRSYQCARDDFPFKALMCCDICSQPFKAGYSRSRNGDRYGYYQCARGHKQVSIRKDKLHNDLADWLGELRFTPETALRFEDHIRAVWVEKVGGLNRRLSDANREVAGLRDEADAIFEKIKMTGSALIIARLEADYEALEQRIKLLEANRDHAEFGEADMNRTIKWARHMVEHLDELIIGADSDGLRSLFWSLIFCTNPTLSEIKNRTAPISPLVRLKDTLAQENGGLVGQDVFGVNQVTAELSRWGQSLARVQTRLETLFPAHVNPDALSLPRAA